MSAANAAKAGYNSLILLSGAPEGIRTPDLCLRRAALYPAELRAREGLDSEMPTMRQRASAVVEEIFRKAEKAALIAWTALCSRW